MEARPQSKRWEEIVIVRGIHLTPPPALTHQFVVVRASPYPLDNRKGASLTLTCISPKNGLILNLRRTLFLSEIVTERPWILDPLCESCCCITAGLFAVRGADQNDMGAVCGIGKGPTSRSTVSARGRKAALAFSFWAAPGILIRSRDLEIR